MIRDTAVQGLVWTPQHLYNFHIHRLCKSPHMQWSIWTHWDLVAHTYSAYIYISCSDPHVLTQLTSGRHQQNAVIFETRWQNGLRNRTAWLKSSSKWWHSKTLTHFFFPTKHHIGMLPHFTFTLCWEQYLSLTKSLESFRKSIVTSPQSTLGTIYQSTDTPWTAFTDRVNLI